jgi:hypothetical protein
MVGIIAAIVKQFLVNSELFSSGTNIKLDKFITQYYVICQRLLQRE